MQISPSRSDLVWNYAGSLLGIGGNFLLLPALVFYLDNDSLGLWYVFMSIASLAQLMQFGFGPTFARNVAYCWSGAQSLRSQGLADRATKRDTNFPLLRQMISVSKIVFAVISSVTQILVVVLGTLYILHLADNQPRQVILIAWACFCVAIFLNMYFAYFDAVLRGIGAISELNKATVGSNLLKIAVTIGLLASGMGLSGATVGYLVQAIAYRLMCGVLLYRYKGLGIRLREAKSGGTRIEVRSLLRVVAPNAARDGIVSISNFLATTANSITCSMLLSLSATSVYSLTLQLVNAAANVSVVLISTYQPALQSAFANGDKERELTWISRGLASFYLLYWVAVGGLVFVVSPILSSLRDSYSLDYRALLVMALYTFLWKQQSVCAAYIANTNRIPYMLPFLISSVGGVAASIMLIYFLGLGLWGLILGPMLVQLCYNNWKWPREVAKGLGTNFFRVLIHGFKNLYKGIVRTQ